MTGRHLYVCVHEPRDAACTCACTCAHVMYDQEAWSTETQEAWPTESRRKRLSRPRRKKLGQPRRKKPIREGHRRWAQAVLRYCGIAVLRYCGELSRWAQAVLRYCGELSRWAQAVLRYCGELSRWAQAGGGERLGAASKVCMHLRLSLPRSSNRVTATVAPPVCKCRLARLIEGASPGLATKLM